ncbi:hypothetical protein [Tenacibaculum haliotis]
MVKWFTGYDENKLQSLIEIN